LARLAFSEPWCPLSLQFNTLKGLSYIITSYYRGFPTTIQVRQTAQNGFEGSSLKAKVLLCFYQAAGIHLEERWCT
jgi:hypothetical protein